MSFHRPISEEALAALAKQPMSTRQLSEALGWPMYRTNMVVSRLNAYGFLEVVGTAPGRRSYPDRVFRPAPIPPMPRNGRPPRNQQTPLKDAAE